jgi:hypothetical protein
MSCNTILSDFIKPYKFGSLPVVVTRRESLADNKPANVVLSDPDQYVVAPSYGRDPFCVPAGEKGAAVDLWWLNRQGGWDRWVFTFKASYSTDISDGRKWQDSSTIERYSYRGEVREKVSVVSQFVDFDTRKALANIRKSIQVYQLMGDGDWTNIDNFIPIVVDSGSFSDYVTGEGKMQVDLTYSYAQLIDVQTQ